MHMRLLALLAFSLLLISVFRLEPDVNRLDSQVVPGHVVEALELDKHPASSLRLHWEVSDIDIAKDALRSTFKVSKEQLIAHSDGVFEIPLGGENERIAEYIVSPELSEEIRPTALSLLPPLLAIFLAFVTRRTLLSLGAGIVLGGMIATYSGGINFIATGELLFVDILYHKILMDAFHLEILAFVIFLSSTVALITRNGGIDGMVNSLTRFAKNSRSVQAVAYFLGMGIFFDDYANTIVVGNSCGPLFDKQNVSRAKLAYIVDSTAAPVAGVAVLSTWVAYQISTFAPQLPTIGMSESQGYSLFLETIPYRFYCLMALFMVGVVIWMQRDFGPMLKVEAKARRSGSTRDDSASEAERIEAKHGVVPQARNGLWPLLVMIFGTAYLIFYLGASAIASDAAAGNADAILALQTSGFEYMRSVLGASDSTYAIFLGSLAAFILAVGMSLRPKHLDIGEVVKVTSQGVKVLFKDAVMVLLMAWGIGKICENLDTAHFLVACFYDIMSPLWLPVILFVSACLIAFATGSSWTTMAILQPNVVLLAYQLGEQVDIGGHTLLVLSIGAVLEGAIFGDHCSPISDTTVLSSTASHCQHIEHVRTQAPYAIVTAVVAITCAYLPVALWGFNPFICLGISMVALVLIVRFVGKHASDFEHNSSDSSLKQQQTE
ncbi:MAG TPA: Na+/H+ antiporter NhaC family protein [Planctomycetes bacterium]|nr:Na+/H+ antiporter NhaC family protein [Planctomycetota bacterium]